MHESDTDGEVGGEESRGVCSFPILLNACECFSIFMRRNFVPTCTERNDARKLARKASTNVNDSHIYHCSDCECRLRS